MAETYDKMKVSTVSVTWQARRILNPEVTFESLPFTSGWQNGNAGDS